jgi:Flp pilus assembly protein TadD
VSSAAPAPTTTGGTPTAPPAPAAPPGPKLTGVDTPINVIARRGHARFLVGVRVNVEARVVVRVISVRSGATVKTIKTIGRHAPGRVWMLIDANNDRGFQLKEGRYRLEILAVDAAKKRSKTITRRFGLKLRPARGTLHAYTVPTWPSIIGGLAAAPGGQIVAGVPTGSATAVAGIQRGDVIRTLNGVNVDARGAWFVAMRHLPADTAIAIELDRAGVRQTVQYTPPPDWTLVPAYQPSLKESTDTAPTIRAYQYALVRERLDAKDTAGAKALFANWTAADKAGAPGELLSGAISAAEGAYVDAAGAYNRALTADPTLAAASFQQGLARTANKQNDRAILAFEKARALDPTDAIAATFHAYALLSANQFDAALAATDAAIALDARYEEARIARGVALIGLARTAEGVADLRRGLLLLDDPVRAQQIITQSLEPNTP